MFYISTIILILRKFPTRLQYWRKEKSLFDISRYVPSHLLSISGRSRARRKTHAFLWGMNFLIRKVNLLQPILLFIAGIGNFPLSASKCMPPFVLSLFVEMCMCNLTSRTRPGHSQVAARRGHVHAPYTSLGSGVAVGLKGRYTHRELRWGRPTGSACVGVGDSTPLKVHPSGG